MFGAIAGGIASALAGGAMSKLFGGGQKAASGGIQGDVLATDNNTVGMGDAGIKSAIQGSNVLFFFQAEDGIRDAQESRGLGDVYKRQEQTLTHDELHNDLEDLLDELTSREAAVLRRRFGLEDDTPQTPVSYTHLTLPTILRV